jgi:hypothetical protein
VGFNGTGVGVAVIDSGMNADPNLKKIAYACDFTDPKAAALTASFLASVTDPLLSTAHEAGVRKNVGILQRLGFLISLYCPQHGRIRPIIYAEF